MEKKYFEDFRVGDIHVTQGRTITEADIVTFASFTGDWNAIHTDAVYAESSIFGERIAHGMLTLVVGTSLLIRLIESLIPKSLIVITGLNKIKFLSPVKIGDTIHMEADLTKITPMPDSRNIMDLKFSIKNQDSISVLTGHFKLVAECSTSDKMDKKGC